MLIHVMRKALTLLGYDHWIPYCISVTVYGGIHIHAVGSIGIARSKACGGGGGGGPLLGVRDMIKKYRIRIRAGEQSHRVNQSIKLLEIPKKV